jgi:hypothetical protein
MDTVTNWRKSNPWFDNRIDANRIANMIHVNLLEERPNLSLRENLDLVSEEMKRRFPEKIGYNPQQQRQEFQSSQQQEFHDNGRDNNRQNNEQQWDNGNQRRDDRQQDNYQSQQNDRTQRQYSSVEGGQSFNSAGSPRNKKGWSQIHPNDRQMFENMVFPTGVYGNDLAKAREQWASDYHTMYEE